MAKVKTLNIHKVDPNTRKTLLDCNVDIKVNTSGIFKAELPDEVFNRLKAINMLPEGYLLNKGITANTMNELELVIHESIKPLIEFKEIENKIVIMYAISTACIYAKTVDGQYFPNACDQSKEYIQGPRGNFQKGNEERNDYQQGDYHVGLICKLRRKITNEYMDGTQKTYYDSVKVEELGENGQWLRRLIGMGESHWGNRYAAESEIDYTEKNALFFRKFICGLFSINDYVSKLNDSNVLQEMILRQKALPGSME